MTHRRWLFVFSHPPTPPSPPAVAFLMAGFRYDPKGCFSHVHGAYEQELNRRRSAAEKIEWVDVDEQLMLKHQVRAAAASRAR